MDARPLGKTGLTVSALGLGAGRLGAPELPESEVSRLLGRALDAGINLIDTARSYGLSETRLGRYLGRAREQVVLCTKGGYGVEGAPDWTGEAITYGIHRALRELRTDHLDIFFLHSCPLAVASREDIVEALATAQQAGKIRVAGYSGEGDALAWAVREGPFGAVECSVNLVDQRNLDGLIAEASSRGIGVIAKRPLANACWAHLSPPEAGDVGIYYGRFQRLDLASDGMPWHELALRFAAYAPGVCSAIAGCSAVKHLDQNLAAVERGPLPDARVAELRAAFAHAGASWEGLI